MLFQSPAFQQRQSPLFTLPAELRQEIFTLCLSTNKSITNPVLAPTDSSDHSTDTFHNVPPLGTALHRTCQRANLEVPTKHLFTNTICVTRPSHLTALLSSLPTSSIALIHSVTLSLAETPLHTTSSDGMPDSPLAREWEHYLTCPPPTRHCPGAWCSRSPTLATALPGLTALTLDLEDGACRLPAQMAHLGLKPALCVELGNLLRGLAQAMPAPPSDEEATASASGEMRDDSRSRHRPAGRGAIQGLRTLCVTGRGAHMWDLGGVARPSVLGEWTVVGSWVERVGEEIVAWLGAAVEGDGAHSQPWTGMVWTGRRFCLVGAGGFEEVRALGYDNAMAWDEVVRMTETRQRRDHPVFALFVQ